MGRAVTARYARFHFASQTSVTDVVSYFVTDVVSRCNSEPYRVVDRGADFVVIESYSPLEEVHKTRIRFINEGKAYWIETGILGNGLEERFDLVTP